MNFILNVLADSTKFLYSDERKYVEKNKEIFERKQEYIYIYIYIYICVCVCVCVCVYFDSIFSLIHISLNIIDIFCLHIFSFVNPFELSH